MVRLNKTSLDNQQLEKLFKQFSTTLNKASKSEVDQLMSVLLGHEEKIMISKRLGAILLLQQELRPYTVSQILKMSPTTVGKIQTDLLAGNYESTLKVIKKDHKSYQAILHTIDTILTVGGTMPHYGQRPENLR